MIVRGKNHQISGEKSSRKCFSVSDSWYYIIIAIQLSMDCLVVGYQVTQPENPAELQMIYLAEIAEVKRKDVL